MKHIETFLHIFAWKLPKAAICLVFIFLLSFGCRDNQRISSAQTSINVPTETEAGRQAFAKVKAEYPKAQLSIWGGGMKSPQAALWILESSWAALTPTQQADLCLYVQSQIPALKANPGPYLGISPKAQAYSKLEENCRSRLDAESWMIGVGELNKDGIVRNGRVVKSGKPED